MFKGQSESRICVFCKLSHRVYLKKEVSVFDGLVLLGITGLLAFAIWQGPDLRSMLIFMSLAFLMQVFLRVRYRESVKCPHCGFDPILYHHDSERAAQKVNDFMEKRKDNPHYMLRPQPKIKHQVQKTGGLTKPLDPALPEAEEVDPSLIEGPSI